MNIVITGASKGIGKAIANIFAKHGHNLYLCSRGEATLYKTMEEFMNLYPEIQVKAKPFDLGIKEQAVEFGEWCLGYGVPGVLINNAGLFEPGSVHNEPDGVLEKQIAGNLYSAYHLTRTLLPKMMEGVPPEGRHVFNMCSVASLNAYKNGGAYSISKFALYGFSKNLREELKPHNIKVTHVIPGAAYTESWAATGLPESRFMESHDIARMIYSAFELSPRACVEEIVLRPQLGDL